MEEKKVATVEQAEIEARRAADKVHSTAIDLCVTISNLCETIKVLTNENRELKLKLEQSNKVDIDQK